jgi:hypothetical protein
MCAGTMAIELHQEFWHYWSRAVWNWSWEWVIVRAWQLHLQHPFRTGEHHLW